MSDSFVTTWTVTHQAPLFTGFSRQKYWSGLPFPPLEDLPNPGIKQYLLHCQMDSLPLGHQESHRQSLQVFIILCSRPGPQVSTASHAGNHLGPFSPVKLKMIQHHPTWSRISQGSPNIPQNHNNKMAAKVTVLECPVIQQ